MTGRYRRRVARRVARVASVAFVNAKPLIHGLADAPGVALELDVPSGLLDRLRGGAEAALLPTIDLQRLDDAEIVPAGGIGCDGATLTVRLFSREPFDRITTLACDPDSHTSVALARVVLARRYGVRPELTDLRRAAPDGPRLLIGDKVVCEEPAGFAHQLDLGAAWKDLTGLPFVFAVWTTRRGTDLGDLPRRLVECRERGTRPGALAEIVRDHALPRGWPAGVAMRYFTEHLRFAVGPREVNAIRLFHRMAAEEGAIARAREVAVREVD